MTVLLMTVRPRRPTAAPPGGAAPTAGHVTKIGVEGLNFYYGQTRALTDIHLSIKANLVTALIGPSGCGKSTFLRALNRMNDIVPGARVDGLGSIDGHDIYAASVDVVALRRRVGMVFQKSNPFPKSIFDNVAYGPRIGGNRKKKSDRKGVV